MAKRILFIVHNLARTRHFETVIQGLARRRHTVIVAAARKHRPLKAPVALKAHLRVEVTSCPVRRIDRWDGYAEPLRRIGDHLRFFDPRCAHLTKIAERAESYTPDAWREALQRHPWLRHRWRLVQRLLAAVERLIPPDRYFELYLKAERIETLLVTPLVDFNSYQADYIKAAHRLGIPVAFLPFSWDNLTNRGRIHVQPDAVMVWNEHQKREAMELHDVAAERIIITGAPRFDAFIELSCSTTREAFFAKLGFDPARPLILYVCSSRFVAPDEVWFVRKWVAALRESPHPQLRDAVVLIRPHPAHDDHWTEAAVAGLPNVALWNEKLEMNADQGLFDSLSHCRAVVGLNTSAMIEAAIVGRPVYAITPPEFSGGQSETMHFRYLLDQQGGPVTVATTVEEHLEQLATATDGNPEVAARSRGFVSSFVRPRGMKKRVTDVMIREIEQLSESSKAPARTRPWQYPLRRLLLAGLALGAPARR